MLLETALQLTFHSMNQPKKECTKIVIQQILMKPQYFQNNISLWLWPIEVKCFISTIANDLNSYSCLFWRSDVSNISWEWDYCLSSGRTGEEWSKTESSSYKNQHTTTETQKIARYLLYKPSTLIISCFSWGNVWLMIF